MRWVRFRLERSPRVSRGRVGLERDYLSDVDARSVGLDYYCTTTSRVIGSDPSGWVVMVAQECE